MKETAEQKWLGAFTTAQREDKQMTADVCKLLGSLRKHDVDGSENVISENLTFF